MAKKTTKTPATTRKSPAQKAREARARRDQQQAAQAADPTATGNTGADVPQDPAPDAAPRTKARTRGKRKAEATPATNQSESAQPGPTTPPATTDAAKHGVILAAFAEAYLKALEAAGKGRGTVFSYGIDLALAVKHFGDKTRLSSLTEQKVIKFFESDVVTKTRTGKSKAKPTVDKTRRVLRQALAWAVEQRIIDASPVPDRYAGRQKKATATTA